jgi:hypothetical protein
MIDKKKLETVFKIADVATKIVDVTQDNSDDDFVRMKAAALALVSICGARDMDDMQMCRLVFDTYHEMTDWQRRGPITEETKQ